MCIVKNYCIYSLLENYQIQMKIPMKKNRQWITVTFTNKKFMAVNTERITIGNQLMKKNINMTC